MNQNKVPFYQVFWCFTYYDKVLKKRCRHNDCKLYSARYHRNELLMNKERYSMVSQIFQSTLEVGAV